MEKKRSSRRDLVYFLHSGESINRANKCQEKKETLFSRSFFKGTYNKITINSTMDAINLEEDLVDNVAGEDHQQNDDIALNVAGAGVDNGVEFDDPVDAVVNSDDDDDDDIQNVDDNSDNNNNDNNSNEAEETNMMINDLISVLQNRNNFPVQQRDGKIVELARYFHRELKNDIHAMITDQTYGANYAGLDANRDTEAEVETALRSYPENLERRKTTLWKYNDDFHDDDDDEEIGGWMEVDNGNVPIYCLTHVRKSGDGWSGHNIKAIPFIHLFAQLAIEFNSSFDDYEGFTGDGKETRGGLLITVTRERVDAQDIYETNSNNVLEELVSKSDPSGIWAHTNEQVDSICFTQLARLRESGLLTKHDVVHLKLVPNLLHSDATVGYENLHFSGLHFSEQRFFFLTEWNPESLLKSGRSSRDYRHSTFYFAAYNSLEGFRAVCDSIIRYYPKKRGIVALFQEDYRNPSELSLFGIACERFGREQVIDIIERTLTRYSITVPLQTADALISAAMDDGTHLDGVYSILRRQPDVLIQQLLLPVPAPHGDAGSQYHTTNHKKQRL